MHQIQQDLKRIIQEASIDRLKSQSQMTNISLQESMVLDDQTVHGHWMSVILISGKPLRISFKVHYSSEVAKYFASKIFSIDPKDITHTQADDFVKEYCNMTAGLVKKSLESSAQEYGISIPLVTRGFDELFEKMSVDEKSTGVAKWEIGTPDNKMTCTCIIEIYKPEVFEKFKYVLDIKNEDDGEVDFL